MARRLLILLLIIAVSFAVVKILDKNAAAQDENGLSWVLENQRMILEKLDVIDGKIDGLKTRIR
ncbi:MAG: hypothetical protein Q8R48_01720 [Candidatus Omnitrophota bacterium]|nr:hypothetical protein [Candidatus Omnitrophota bacterium]